MIAIDTETTGLDLHHGASPFFVSICFEDYRQLYWEWDVDYVTREVVPPKQEVEEIKHELDKAEGVVGHNLGFDVRALTDIGVDNWDWNKCHDTMYSAHMIDSSTQMNLEAQALIHAGISVRKWDEACEEACSKARRICISKFPQLRIAHKDDPGMPSAGGKKIWKGDLGLMQYLCKNHPEELPEWGYKNETWVPGDDPLQHPWMFLNRDYGNVDTATTMRIHLRHMKIIKERGLEKIYEARREGLRIVYGMGSNGLTAVLENFREVEDNYLQESIKCGKICTNIAKSYGIELALPKAGRNKALDDLLFNDPEGMNLEPVTYTKTRKPGLDKDALMSYQLTLPDNSREKLFVETLAAKRLRDNGISSLQSYNRFLVKEQMKLYPGFNPCGTATLRWTSANPSGQTISKKSFGDRQGFNLRYAFGPRNGYEWFSADYNNLELRLTAYESGEQAMMEIFEKPDEGPYYGSYHLLIFDTLHPKLYAKYGVGVKNVYKSTWYARTKNGNFADQYGAVMKKAGNGTADKAYGVPGAQAIISERLVKKAGLNTFWVDFARKNGYVYTTPDKEIDPTKGYPIVCPKERGQVKPTIPLNYHIQGTACWVVWRAMVKCQEYLDQIGVGKILLNVHDELVFEFPTGEGQKHWKKLKELMESVGHYINVPLTVGFDYHVNNWGEGVEL